MSVGRGLVIGGVALLAVALGAIFALWIRWLYHRWLTWQLVMALRRARLAQESKTREIRKPSL
jgi:hypothetical protein